MGKKFTPQDLFRIAEENLTTVDAFEFRFICTTSIFREAIGDVFGPEANVTDDERDLLEKIFQRLRAGGILRGGTR